MSNQDFRRLDADVAVAGQLWPQDLAEAKAQGFVAIVNNRPDGEQPGQPSDAEMAAAAASNGLSYVAIPVDHSGFDGAQIAAMAEALDGATGPLLAYCRSGTRSTWLWALARARLGDEPDALIEKAAAQGYDIEQLRGALG